MSLSNDIRYTLEHLIYWDAQHHQHHTHCLWCTLRSTLGTVTVRPTTHSLLVGINDDKLTGPVNDVHKLRHHLQRHFQAMPQLLLNEQATKANILFHLQHLVHRLKHRDTGIFHFSGHGTSITNDSLDQSDDGTDEVILTHDQKLIRDDLIHNLLQQMPDTCTMIMIFDNCSSATMADIPNLFWLNDQAQLQQRQSFDKPMLNGKVIIFSASADDKYAYEVNGSGLLSSAIVQSLYPGKTILSVLRDCDAICRPYGQTVHVSLCNVAIQDRVH